MGMRSLWLVIGDGRGISISIITIIPYDRLIIPWLRGVGGVWERLGGMGEGRDE